MNRMGWTLVGLLISSGVGFLCGLFVAETPTATGTDDTSIEPGDSASPLSGTTCVLSCDRTRDARSEDSSSRSSRASHRSLTSRRMRFLISTVSTATLRSQFRENHQSTDSFSSYL